jgi:hypothetical protein
MGDRSIRLTIYKDSEHIWIDCEDLLINADGECLSEAFKDFINRMTCVTGHYYEVEDSMLSKKGKKLKDTYLEAAVDLLQVPVTRIYKQMMAEEGE